MKRTIVFLYMILVPVIICLTGSWTTNQPADQPIPLTAAERAERIKQCAACHPKEYEQEMIGPHVASYTKMLEHAANADTSRYFPRGYEKFVHEKSEKLCVGCHASENLFETVFKGLELEKDKSRLTADIYPGIKAFPKPRKDTLSRMSGTDCLTCHGAGNSVVTKASYVQKGPTPPACNPIASEFFSTNTACVSCHPNTTKGMVDNIHNPLLTADMSCNKCHAEYDEHGKFTHYYYWRDDAEDKLQHPLMQAAFNDLSITRAEGNVFHLEWKNMQAQHPISEAVELLAIINFLDKDGAALHETRVRLNNKASHDMHFAAYFEDNIVPGAYGYSFAADEEPFRDSCAIQGTVSKIIIEGYDKPQYWIDDKAGKQVFKKVIDL